MTWNQYIELASNFADYANMVVTFNHYIPSADKYSESRGILKGIGLGCNDNTIIIAFMGQILAIHYKDVKFPKL